jgi:hypothetical protein
VARFDMWIISTIFQGEVITSGFDKFLFWQGLNYAN